MNKMDIKPRILILRGIPGSGKTTLCKEKYKNWTRVSVDDWFTDENGRYKFNPKQLQRAHDWCYELTLKFLSNGENVIVDNTNRTINEFKRYLHIPNTEVLVYRVVGNYGTKKTIPQQAMLKHINEYQPCRGEISVRLIFTDGKSTFQTFTPKPVVD